MELTSLYCVQKLNNGPYSEQLSNRHTPYLSNIDFNIIFPYVYLSFPLQFPTLNTPHRAPFVCVSIFSPSLLLSRCFVAVTPEHYCTLLCTEGLNNSDAALWWQSVGSTDEDRQYGNTRSITIGLMERKFSEMWNVIIVMACECLCVCLLCLNFEILLCWIVCLTFWTEWVISASPTVNIMMTMAGSLTLYLLCVARLNRWRWPVRQDKVELHTDWRVVSNVIVFIVRSVDMPVRGFVRLWLTVYWARNLLLWKYLCIELKYCNYIRLEI